MSEEFEGEEMIRAEDADSTEGKSPEERLFFAIIARAVADYTQYEEGTHWSIFADAEAFLFSSCSETETLSLPWIAAFISDDPERFVACVRRLALRVREGSASLPGSVCNKSGYNVGFYRSISGGKR